jgi:type VI secretion system secreted protein VgrG
MSTTYPNLSFQVTPSGSSTTPVVFTVTKVHGKEAISAPFWFDLDLEAPTPLLDASTMLQQPATLIMTRLWGSTMAEGNIFRHGMVADFRLTGRRMIDTATYVGVYKCRLVPRLWRTSLQRRAQVYTGTSVILIVEGILTGSIDGSCYTANISKTTSPGGTQYSTSPPPATSREMVMQYQESDLDFMSRWLEYTGVHYTFSHSDGVGGTDVVVLSNTNDFQDVAQYPVMFFTENAIGFSDTPGCQYDDHVANLVGSQQCIPQQVVLQGYNWQSPDSYLSSTIFVEQAANLTAATARGIGERVECNCHFSTQDDGDQLAQVRAEEIFCREVTYTGTSFSPFFAAGGTFTLSGHYNTALPEKYLLIEVTHDAEQSTSGSLNDGKSWCYSNTFVAVPADRTYRPQRRTSWPMITSMLTGKIYNASDDSSAAPVDAYGRYQVVMPFALQANNSGGQSTCQIRMAQPYAGSEFGMHFPLHGGTEVTLTFLNGDPDRPVISGALFDATHTDPVTDHNATQGGIKTYSGSSIGFEDDSGNSKISIAAGSGGAAITVGTLGKSHTGPLTLDNVQIAATKIDSTAGTISTLSSPIIINNSVIKYMAVASPLNLLFMIAPLVSKSGNDGKDPVLGISVQPGDQERIDAANAVMFTLMQTILQLTIANVLSTVGAYNAKLATATKTPGALTKAGMWIATFLKTWPYMLVGGLGNDGISLTVTPLGLLNKIDATGLGKNISISTAGGSMNLKAPAGDILAVAGQTMKVTAPSIQLIQTSTLGGLTIDSSMSNLHHDLVASLVVGPTGTSQVLLEPLKGEMVTPNTTIQGLLRLTLKSVLQKIVLDDASISSTGGIIKTKADISASMECGEGKIAINAAGIIKLSSGLSSIEISPAGITIKGPKVTVQADAMLSLKSDGPASLGGMMVQIKGQTAQTLG